MLVLSPAACQVCEQAAALEVEQAGLKAGASVSGQRPHSVCAPRARGEGGCVWTTRLPRVWGRPGVTAERLPGR